MLKYSRSLFDSPNTKALKKLAVCRLITHFDVTWDGSKKKKTSQTLLANHVCKKTRRVSTYHFVSCVPVSAIASAYLEPSNTQAKASWNSSLQCPSLEIYGFCCRLLQACPESLNSKLQIIPIW